MTKRIALMVALMLVASAGTALAWGPTDPTDRKADPDGDKLGNLDEFRAGTNPLNPDTDGGGCWDGWEVMYGLDPANIRDDNFDSDNDGWTNIREFREGTNPLNPNTDNDNYPLDSTDPHPLTPDDPWYHSKGGIGTGFGSGAGQGYGMGQGQGEGPGPDPGPVPGPGPVPAAAGPHPCG